jgi:hypothetical protein
MSKARDCMRKDRFAIRENSQTPYLGAQSGRVGAQQSPGRWDRGRHLERRQHGNCWFDLWQSHEVNMVHARMMLGWWEK